MRWIVICWSGDSRSRSQRRPGGSAPGSPGVTCPSSSARGRRCASGTTGSASTGPGTGSTPGRSSRPTQSTRSTGPSASTPRSTRPTSTRPPSRAPQGELWNHKNLLTEPADHAIGRSCGGLSTKIHHACDGRGRQLVMLLGPGQGNDSPMFGPVHAAISVPRLGSGRPRTRPDRVVADKAYFPAATAPWSAPWHRRRRP